MDDIKKVLKSNSQEEKMDALLHGFYNFSKKVEKDIGQLKEDVAELKNMKEDVAELKGLTIAAFNDINKDIIEIKEMISDTNNRLDTIRRLTIENTEDIYKIKNNNSKAV
ncbi:DUF2746 domain-containing protein [Iocasia frigidifontis]|uniref:DUF2746 domain-containing protein n=1 Tax=Iocasia fonsfrigidae TaxID=2682810 RepID=A0A8A7K4R7_9FIRM|nr:hypothetical protein [Iocasia fonsfrigidae]QTL96723.1 DUF2746 domain-containing protein [Iocasia fonsfrigidae]